jgi:hypothetical protein
MDKFSFFNKRKGYVLAEFIDSVIIPFSELNISENNISRSFQIHKNEKNIIFSGYRTESIMLKTNFAGDIQAIDFDSKIYLFDSWSNFFSEDGFKAYNFTRGNNRILQRTLNTAFTYSDGYTTEFYDAVNASDNCLNFNFSEDGLIIYGLSNSNGLLKINLSSPYDITSVISETVINNELIRYGIIPFGKDNNNNNLFFSFDSVFVEKGEKLYKIYEVRFPSSFDLTKRFSFSIVGNNYYAINRKDVGDNALDLVKYKFTIKE